MNAATTLDRPITGRWVIDLPEGVDHRRELSVLPCVPDRAHVTVRIHDTHPHPESVRLMREHHRRVQFEVEGVGPDARLAQWVRAISSGELW